MFVLKCSHQLRVLYCLKETKKISSISKVCLSRLPSLRLTFVLEISSISYPLEKELCISHEYFKQIINCLFYREFSSSQNIQKCFKWYDFSYFLIGLLAYIFFCPAICHAQFIQSWDGYRLQYSFGVRIECHKNYVKRSTQTTQIIY